MNLMDNFTAEEQSEILELARMALQDAESYTIFADAMDLSDEYLKSLQERIEEVTNGLPEFED